MIVPEEIVSLLGRLGAADAVPIEYIPALLGEIERVRVGLWCRLLRDRVEGPVADRLLSIGEAAARLAATKDWLRRHGDLPFVVRLSEGQIRYSEQGIERFIRQRTRS
jgi:hypothetical protein